LSEIALDDKSHVLLRTEAVAALESASRKVAESGVFDERQLRQAREALQTLALRDDNSSYFSGASSAYERLASAGVPGYVSGASFPAGAPVPVRGLASKPSLNQ
jgi:hypothetical protein